MNEKEMIDIIDDCLPTTCRVLDGDNNSIIIKEKTTGKEFEIIVKEIMEWKSYFVGKDN